MGPHATYEDPDPIFSSEIMVQLDDLRQELLARINEVQERVFDIAREEAQLGQMRMSSAVSEIQRESQCFFEDVTMAMHQTRNELKSSVENLGAKFRTEMVAMSNEQHAKNQTLSSALADCEADVLRSLEVHRDAHFAALQDLHKEFEAVSAKVDQVANVHASLLPRLQALDRQASEACTERSQNRRPSSVHLQKDVSELKLCLQYLNGPSNDRELPSLEQDAIELKRRFDSISGLRAVRIG